MTEPQFLQQTDRTWVRFGHRKLIYFAGCDYFRLASHPRVLAAVQTGLKRYGLNVAASRLTTGNHVLYRQLEQRLARFFAAESATLVSTGYLTNLVAAQALAGHFSHALLDSAAHPSLADAAQFLNCPVLRFESCSAEALEVAVGRCGPGAKLLLLTDGMFARDGSAAPLREYLQVLPRDARLLVDDAHAAGVLGRTGKGSLEHAGVSRRRIIQTVTLSKAFGTYGGAILADERVHQQILDRSSMFIGGTPLPLPLAYAALKATELLDAQPGLRQRLFRNANYVKTGVRNAGLALPDRPGPIIPLPPMNKRGVAQFRAALLDAGIFPSFIKYPGAPANGYFRFVISSEHSREQLDRLIRVLNRKHNASSTSFH
jgi:7-keto-8-aminopelargonate synthetase-like enzyme